MRYCATLLLGFCLTSMNAGAQTGKFIHEIYASGFNQAIGLTFDANGRMYVWEKAGRLWIVENGQKADEPLIDIAEEVGGWRDFGLLSVALDPNFLSNGHIYLFYLVDRHHLLHYGTASYNPNFDDYFSASIARVTRYTAESATAFTSINYSSRKILIGETRSTGIPSLHESHLGGDLVFGTDGSLMLTTGDAASYLSNDEGSAQETYFQQALDDGIIRPEENIGSYRVQSLESLNGKLLRIDPETGDGLPSNPYFDPANPRSPQSRTWGRGLRNPFNMNIRPETGSHDPNDANPGSFYIGDVGQGTREEINVANAAGLNFGWPKFEGMTFQGRFPDPRFALDRHDLPKIDWRFGPPRASANGQIFDIGSAEMPGPFFQGNCSIGGTWYTGDDLPSRFNNTFFFGDYGGKWIRNAVFDEFDNPIEVRDVLSNVGALTALATSQKDGGMYFVDNGSTVRKLRFVQNNSLPPTAIALADIRYGAGPLTVQFTGDQSNDPEYSPLRYRWDFGDGTFSEEANPVHTFSANTASPRSFSVKLSVTDRQRNTSVDSLLISLNNTPPTIEETSLDGISTYVLDQATQLPLSATVSDAEHDLASLEFTWHIDLFHNDHSHPEAPIQDFISVVQLTPIGCEEEAMYWYQVVLEVKDPEGLATRYQKNIFPDCGGEPQSISFPQVEDVEVNQTIVPFEVSASSGLPVSVFVVDGPAFMSGSELRLLGEPGIVTLRAVQTGNEDFQPAEPLEQTFRVNASVPVVDILFPLPGLEVLGDAFEMKYALSGDFVSNDADHLRLTLDDDRQWLIHQFEEGFLLENIPPGLHTLSLEIVKADNSSLPFESAKQTIQFVMVPGGQGTGLQASYFEGQDFDVLVETKIDPVVDFDWAGGKPIQALGTDNFSIIWEGLVEIPSSDTYFFHLTSDDGTRLFLNNDIAIWGWVDQAATTRSAERYYRAGQKVPIRVEYYENGGFASVKLEWENSTFPIEIIPQSALYPPGVKISQEIIVEAIPDQRAEAKRLELNAYANSGLPVSFEVLAGPALLEQGGLELSGVEGEVVILVKQPGNEAFEPVEKELRFFVKADLGDPQIEILSPQMNASFLNTELEVRYKAFGDLANVAHVYVFLDGLAYQTFSPFDTTFSFAYVAPGPHTLRMVFLDEALVPLPGLGTETTFSIIEPKLGCVLTQGWETIDIGDPSQPGFACGNEKTFYIQSHGENIGEAEDDFHFAYQKIDGNFLFTAEIVGLGESNNLAKVGVMMRRSLDANSAFAFAGTTVNEGSVFQVRNNDRASSQNLNGGNGFRWLRLMRLDEVVSGWVSEDGKNWQQTGVDWFPISGEMFVGMAVSSYDRNTENFAIFEHVSIEALNLDPSKVPTKPQVQAVERLRVNALSMNWEDRSDNEWGFVWERYLDQKPYVDAAGAMGMNQEGVEDLVHVDQMVEYRVRAFNEYGYSDWSEPFLVNPIGSELCNSFDLGEGKFAFASSIEQGFEATLAIDGTTATRWSSQFSDPQWITIDLGRQFKLCGTLLLWEHARGKTFELQASRDNNQWQSLARVENNSHHINLLEGFDVTGRYIRMYGYNRETPYGYSLWGMRVYGTPLSGSNEDIYVYPNPAQEALRVELSSEVATPAYIQVFNSMGQRILSQNISLNEGITPYLMDVGKFSQGHYWIRAEYAGTSRQIHFVVE